MATTLARRHHSWRFVAAAPPREVFAVMEQMLGTPPYRYEVTGVASARIVEAERKGFFGQWRSGPRRPRWVTCQTSVGEAGTVVEVEASRGRGPLSRALQLVYLLSRGNRDRRTIYRDRTTPAGPVTLVASWAGTAYALFTDPSHAAPRGAELLTATPLEAIGNHGPFVKVRTGAGVEGWIERDQLVPAPGEATRDAQTRTAVYG